MLMSDSAFHDPILYRNTQKRHAATTEITLWLSPAAAAWCATVDRYPSMYPAGAYHLEPTPERDVDVDLERVGNANDGLRFYAAFCIVPGVNRNKGGEPMRVGRR
jgi:hypothetical protein